MKRLTRSAAAVAVCLAALATLAGCQSATTRPAAAAVVEESESGAGRIVTGEFSHESLPRAMKYSALLPEGYENSNERYPVLFHLYPGPPDSHTAIRRWQPHIELARLTRNLPEVIVVTPAIDMSLYQDPQGDGRKWERAFVGPFFEHLHEEFRLREERPAFYATGLSAGGAITLRLGLRHPNRFGAIAALAPGIEAAFNLEELDFEDTFWRPRNAYDDVDPEAWAEYHPLNVARTNPARIREAGLGIYLETGDVDSFELDRGTELMHRVLRDNGIAHEYHLRQGVDHHVGTIMPTRWQDAYAYLGDHMRSLPKEKIVADLQAAVDAVRAEAEKDNTDPAAFNRARMKLFGFSRRQSELESEVLQRLIEAAKRQ